MDKKKFELLGKYNKETNEKMNSFIKKLSEEEWNKEFPGFYKSIHGLCSHIFICDYLWLNRLKSIDDYESLTDEYFNKEYNLEEVLFLNINEYLMNRTEMDNIIIDFVNEVTAIDLEKTTKFVNYKGVTFEKRMDVILMHMFNHDTHHRGMISLYLEMLGNDNDYSGLYFYG